jgi:F0F1-type ATP synthase assembly protein I
LFGGVVGGIVLAATIANFIAIPHPLWLSISTLVGIVLSTVLAMRLAPNTTAEPTEDDASEGDPG